MAIGLEIAHVLILLWAKHVLVYEYRTLLSECWYAHKMLMLLSWTTLMTHWIIYFKQYTPVMTFIAVTKILLWSVLCIL